MKSPVLNTSNPAHEPRLAKATPQLADAIQQTSAALAPLRVGLLGLGTVGAGTFKVLKRNARLIEQRTGRKIIVTMVAARNLERAAQIVAGDAQLVDDPFRVVNHPDIDIVVEAIGGITLAKDLVLQAVAAGKHVVTANKALLALHGKEIFAAARNHGMIVAYEGAVAVSIPIIKVLREGLAGNRVEWLAGIINGTTNFILSEMEAEGTSFTQALENAQKLGYAEQDAAFDVDGIDAAHKLTLLASNAFGIPLCFDDVCVKGIANIEATDLGFAKKMGYCIKLLGIARQTTQGIVLKVAPALVPTTHLLSKVNGSMNAVLVKSDAAGITMHYGAGAGAEETASAVVADLIDISRVMATLPKFRVPYLGFQDDALIGQAMAPPDQIGSTYYVRVNWAGSPDTGEIQRRLMAEQDTSIQRVEVFQHPEQPLLQCACIITGPLTGNQMPRLIETLRSLQSIVSVEPPIAVESLK